MSTVVTVAHDKARTAIGAIRSTSVGGTVSFETESYQKSIEVMNIIKEQIGLPMFDYVGGFVGDNGRHRVEITLTEASQ